MNTDDAADLLRVLDQAESDERMRLADLIHDEPLQLVAAAMLRLDMLRSGGRLNGEQDDVETLLRDAVVGLRRIVALLGPPPSIAALGQSLRHLAAAVTSDDEGQVAFSGVDDVHLDSRGKDSVYRFTVQAVGVLRATAGPRGIQLHLEESADAIRLSIRHGAAAAHVGPCAVGKLQARAAAAGGTAVVTSSPSGVHIHLEVRR